MDLPDENALKESFMAWKVLDVSSTSTRRKLQDCWGQSLLQIQVTLLKALKPAWPKSMERGGKTPTGVRT